MSRKKKCEFCGKAFVAAEKGDRFCSGLCRTTAESMAAKKGVCCCDGKAEGKFIDSIDPSQDCPPSTQMTCPTMKRDFSTSARNCIIGTISSTLPPRPTGILWLKPWTSASE